MITTLPRIAHSERFYKKVDANTLDQSTGVVVPNGDTVAISELSLNGSDPDSYVRVVWDHGGASEDIIASTKGDVHLKFEDLSLSDIQFTGDGSKKLSIVIENNNSVQSPFIGGFWTAVKVG